MSNRYVTVHGSLSRVLVDSGAGWVEECDVEWLSDEESSRIPGRHRHGS